MGYTVQQEVLILAKAVGFRNAVRHLRQLAAEIKRQRSLLYKLNNAIMNGVAGMRKMSGALIGVSLSMLFFGMAIKRLMGNIAKSTLSTFKKIIESSGFTGSAVQQLAVHWEYLKFVIGKVINDVLTPLLPLIINIIGKVTKWIQEHPKLTTAIILGGLAIGTFIMFLGTLAAAFSGIFGFVTALILLIGAGPAAGLVGVFILAAGAALLLAAAIGIFAYEATKHPESIGKIWDTFVNNFKGHMSRMKESFDLLVQEAFPQFTDGWDFIAGIAVWAVRRIMAEVELLATSVIAGMDILRNYIAILKFTAKAVMAAFRGDVGFFRDIGKEIDKLEEKAARARESLGNAVKAQFAKNELAYPIPLSQLIREQVGPPSRPVPKPEATQTLSSLLYGGTSLDPMAQFTAGEKESPVPSPATIPSIPQNVDMSVNLVIENQEISIPEVGSMQSNEDRVTFASETAEKMVEEISRKFAGFIPSNVSTSGA